MSTSTPPITLSTDQLAMPLIHLTYECVLQERGRDSESYQYEIACSITYPVHAGHLSLRVTGQNTYRQSPTREIPFTSHEAGATAYIELQEAEQLEVRVVTFGGAYAKAIYIARKQTLNEHFTRSIVSQIEQLTA